MWQTCRHPKNKYVQISNFTAVLCGVGVSVRLQVAHCLSTWKTAQEDLAKDWLAGGTELCYSLSVRHSTWWGIFTSWVGDDRSWLSHTDCLDVWVEDIWTDVQNTLRIYWNSGNIMVLFLFMSLNIEIRCCCYRTFVPASQRFRELCILVVKSQWGDHLPRVAFYPL